MNPRRLVLGARFQALSLTQSDGLLVERVVTAKVPRGPPLLTRLTLALSTTASGQLVEHRIPKDIETIRLEMGMLHGIGSFG